jgi:hypothetical protein
MNKCAKCDALLGFLARFRHPDYGDICAGCHAELIAPAVADACKEFFQKEAIKK